MIKGGKKMAGATNKEEILKQVHEHQCKGGLTKFKGERIAAMKLAFDYLESEKGLEFSDALKKAWAEIKKLRSKPCGLEQT